jgi:hypothetical protein
VNLVYLLFMLGYESVWVVVVPVQVTELLFPRRAGEPWLRWRSAITVCIAFLVGSRIAWYGWVRQARPRMHAAPYSPPPGMIVLGFVAIAALVTAAWLVRGLGRPRQDDRRRTAPAWLCGLMAFVMGAAWFMLIRENFSPKPVEPFWLAIAAGSAWAALTFVLFVWWSSRRAWSRAHRFAAATGAILACMAVPYMTITTWPKIDVVGEATFDVLALIGFILLARKLFARAKTAEGDAIATK